MTTAKACVLERFEAPLQPHVYPLRARLEPGAALVRTEMAGICGTDVHLWKGQLPITLPVIMGHETVGRLVELGDGLERDWTGLPLSIGDRVTWNSTVSCGQCFYCATKQQPTKCPQRRAYGIGYRCDEPPHFLGGYAEFHYLRPATTVFKLPDDLPTEAVIGAGCALITAIHGVERICVERPSGDSANQMPILPSLWRDFVVVQGAGPVGIAALAVAKQSGAGEVIVIGGPNHRLELAKRFGASHTIDIGEVREPAERIRRVRELTGGYGADAVLECVGIPSAVSEGLEMCRDGGKYLVVGHYCDAGTIEFNPSVITRKQLQVFGSWSSEPRHLQAALAFLRAQRERFPFHKMVTHRFPLEQANEALALMANWQAAKSVLVPAHRPDSATR
ncbi:MAG: zinc-binding dehydrogenase [Verrucomicrobia bacterium]|nr:zinc-binding dehydrogenase [Verrucomicrobiota bacterium]